MNLSLLTTGWSWVYGHHPLQRFLFWLEGEGVYMVRRFWTLCKHLKGKTDNINICNTKKLRGDSHIKVTETPNGDKCRCGSRMSTQNAFIRFLCGQCHSIFCKFLYAQPWAMTEWANIMTFRQETTQQLAEKGLFLRVQRSFGHARKMRTRTPHGHPSGNQLLFQNFVNLTRRNDFTKGK